MLLGRLVTSVTIPWNVTCTSILAEIFPPEKSPGTGGEGCYLSLTRQVQQATFRNMLLIKQLLVSTTVKLCCCY